MPLLSSNGAAVSCSLLRSPLVIHSTSSLFLFLYSHSTAVFLNIENLSKTHFQNKANLRIVLHSYKQCLNMKNYFCFQREEENSSHWLLASNSIGRLCHSIHSKLGSNRLQDVYIEIYKPTFPQNFYISYFVSSAKRFISNQSMLINSYIQREIHISL